MNIYKDIHQWLITNVYIILYWCLFERKNERKRNDIIL